MKKECAIFSQTNYNFVISITFCSNSHDHWGIWIQSQNLWFPNFSILPIWKSELCTVHIKFQKECVIFSQMDYNFIIHFIFDHINSLLQEIRTWAIDFTLLNWQTWNFLKSQLWLWIQIPQRWWEPEQNVIEITKL